MDRKGYKIQRYAKQLISFGQKWAKKHKKFLAVWITGFLVFYWIGVVPVLVGIVVLLLVTAAVVVLLPDLRDAVLEFLDRFIRKRNEAVFWDYLEKHCIRCGYMEEASWNRLLPWRYKVLPYESSFKEITENFAADVERQYIEQDEKLAWLDPIVRYLTKRVMADVAELEQVSNPYLKYTHSTPDAKLIYDAMNYLCAGKKRDGKFMIQRIQLEEEAVRKRLKLDVGQAVPEYYKTAYRINEYFVKRRKNPIEGNLVSEEISIEDL